MGVVEGAGGEGKWMCGRLGGRCECRIPRQTHIPFVPSSPTVLTDEAERHLQDAALYCSGTLTAVQLHRRRKQRRQVLGRGIELK